MPFIKRSEVLEKFKKTATNSSHFVWLISDVQFFESRNGWVFAFQKIGKVTLLALEPIAPDVVQFSNQHQEAFQLAWKEFTDTLSPQISAFVSVYSPFLELLTSNGFQGIKVGEEPWVDLKDCIPRGNAGKGVRSARNKAIHAGLKVEEWIGSDVAKDLKKQKIMLEILQDWRGVRLLELPGFMNAVNPLAYPETRRYFVVRSSEERIEGYLVATPVPGIQSYFLEDIVLRRNSLNGVGELLTLEAMVALGDDGAKEASLGVVSMTTMKPGSANHLPAQIRFLLLEIPIFFKKIYNFDGMKTFRKRFKPQRWESIHIAVKNEPTSRISATGAWLRVLIALLIAFRPRIQLSWQWFLKILISPFQNYPATSFITLVSMSLFIGINRFGEIPTWALTQFGFIGSAPLIEWIPRSVSSDLFYFDETHFIFWGLPYFFLLGVAESTYSRNFFLPFVMIFSILDDILNFLLIIQPFDYFQPSLFKKLVMIKDVGGSLGLATIAGLLLCQLKKNREIFFTILSMALVFGFVFNASQQTHKLQSLVLNLNHFLFFCFGYISGKVQFEYSRHLSRLASKKKPPIAKCVLAEQLDTLKTEQ